MTFTAGIEWHSLFWYVLVFLIVLIYVLVIVLIFVLVIVLIAICYMFSFFIYCSNMCSCFSDWARMTSTATGVFQGCATQQNISSEPQHWQVYFTRFTFFYLNIIQYKILYCYRNVIRILYKYYTILNYTITRGNIFGFSTWMIYTYTIHSLFASPPKLSDKFSNYAEFSETHAKKKVFDFWDYFVQQNSFFYRNFFCTECSET